MSEGTESPAWTRELFDQEVEAITKIASRDSLSARLPKLLERLLDDEALLDRGNHLRVAAYAFVTIRHHAEHGGLSDLQLDRIVGLARTLLQLNGIRPASKRFAFFHAELHASLSQALENQGKPWDALFETQRAHAHQARSAIREAEAALNLGFPKVALRLLRDTLRTAALSADQAHGFILDASARRLSGDQDGAHAALKMLESVAESLPPRAAWEVLWNKVLSKGDSREAARALSRDPRLEGRAVDLWVWARGLSSTNALRHFPRLADARQKTTSFHKGAHDIARCYDNELSLALRIDAARSAIANAEATSDFERRLLLMCAVTRWLLRYNQLIPAAHSLAEVRALSLRATDGVSADIFGLFPDEHPEKLIDRSAQAPHAQATRSLDLPWSDGLELAKTLTSTLGLILKGRLKKWITRGDAERTSFLLDNEARVAEHLASFLRRRRGVLLKIGQIGSYVDGPIEAHVASEFEVLQTDAEAMPVGVVNKIFTASFGRLPRDIFKEFNTSPFAAGSIGQVHFAQCHDGREVAIKVQYPDARQLIAVDLRRARWFRRFFASRLPALDFDALVAEAERHLIAETDYEQEKRNMREFREAFRSEERIYIPDVVDEFSNSRILTMDLVRGRSLAEFVADSSPEAQNEAAKVIMRFYCLGIASLGLFHADPHPGNLRFLSDGRVAILDFGCVKRFSQAFKARRNALFKAFFRQDWDGFRSAYVDVGFAASQDDFELDEVISGFETLFQHSLYDEPFRFGPETPKSIYEAFVSNGKNSAKLKLPPDLLLSLRFDFGLTSVLAKLGAEACWRELTLPMLFEGEPLPPPFPKQRAAA